MSVGGFQPRAIDALEDIDLHDNVARRLFGENGEKRYFHLWMRLRPFLSFLLVLGEVTCIPAFFSDYSLALVICSLMFLCACWPYILVLNVPLMKQTLITFEYWFLTLNNIALLVCGVLMFEWDSRGFFILGMTSYYQLSNSWDGLPRAVMFPNRITRIAFIAGFFGGVVVGLVSVIGFRIGWVTRLNYNLSVSWGPHSVTYIELAAQSLLTMTIFMGKHLIKFARSPNSLNIIHSTLDWTSDSQKIPGMFSLLLPLRLTCSADLKQSGEEDNDIRIVDS